MSLPKITVKHPQVKVELPISKKTVTIRPFLTKEEKLLIFIKEASDAKEVVAIVNRIIDSCCLEPIESAKLPIPDVEFLFVQIRCISKGQTQDLNYICRNMVEDVNAEGEKIKRECTTPMKHTVHLDKLRPFIDPEHTNKIEIPGTKFILVMRYPTYEMVPAGDFKESLGDAKLMDLLVSLIESVVDSEKSVTYNEFTKEEMVAFLDELESIVLDDIVDRFMDKMPALAYDFEFTCPKCSKKHPIKLKGLSDFFS